MTHKFLALAAVSLVALMGAACGDDDDNGPTPLPTRITFTSVLSPANEVPAITGAEATGSGNATIAFNLTRDSAQAITAATADFSVTLAGFPATTAINAAHIHTGVAGATSGVLVDTGLTAGIVTLTNGAGSFTQNGRALQADVAQNIINNPAGFYFNVHSSANPGGVVRGQLVRQ